MRFLFLLISLITFTLLDPCHSIGQEQGVASAQERGSDDKKSAPLRILFAGDIMLDGGPGHLIANGKDPFAACSKLFDDVDLAIGNFECVVGYAGNQQLKPYTFRGPSASPLFVKKYFHAVSLANNHTLDYGPDGLVEMMRVLDEAKLPHFGAGKTLHDAIKPFVFEAKGHKIAIVGFNEFYAEDYAATKDTPGNSPLRDELVTKGIRSARQDLGCDIVIPFLHWGEEMMPEPRPDQRQMARRWIESGASAVLGCHPHVTQTVEVHQGSPIVYSLGNFAFDYFPPDPPQWIGWIAILSVDKDGGFALEIKAITLDPSGCPHPSPTE
jgi:poly-gamma-glutamate capsule biosynthesis protein CapA/YwtB (metallophosphatase superfamily)